MKREYEALSRLVGRNFAVLDDGNSVYLTPKGAVRDQDGKELLPAFPGRARLYERNLKQSGGGASLPDAAPYQQLVTDGEGKWVAEERLAWKEGERVEITWDGNTEGLISVDGADGTAALYKVSDLLLDDTVIKAGVIFLSNGMSVNIAAFSWEEFVSAGLITEDIVLLAEMGVVFVRREGVSAFGFTFPETGVYFFAAKNADSATNYTASFVSDNQTIHPIPAEYLPSPTVFYANENYGYLYHDAEYTTKVSKEELEAAMQGDVWVAFDTNNVYGYNYRAVDWTARRNNGYHYVRIIDDDAGSPVFRTFYTSEYVMDEEG